MSKMILNRLFNTYSISGSNSLKTLLRIIDKEFLSIFILGWMKAFNAFDDSKFNHLPNYSSIDNVCVFTTSSCSAASDPLTK